MDLKPLANISALGDLPSSGTFVGYQEERLSYIGSILGSP